MYKLVLLDLDGTLLTTDKKISDFNCNTIKNLKGNTKFVLASARSFKRIYPYLEQLNLCDRNNYTISFNGGVISNNLGNKILDKKIKKESLLELCDFLVTYNYECYLYTYEERISIKELDNIKDFTSENSIYKVVCLNDKFSISKLRAELPNHFNKLFEITCSEPTIIEFVEKGNTKVNAICKLLETLSIDKQDVIAIGDGENDIGMIDFVGCGIAMGNAIENVKSHADLITDTNDNDGVGKILQRILK